MATVLALDADPLQLELLTLLLRRDRHRVLTTSDPDEALSLLGSESVQLAIVETVLPHHDGYRLCREIVEAVPETALMIVSERDEENEIVRGLLAGADDYIAKPYSPRELMARVQVILRRVSGDRRATTVLSELSVGEITLNSAQFRAFANGRPIALTPREFSLLHALMAAADRVLSRDQLMRVAWGDTFIGPKAVDVCVQRIRKKIRPHVLNGHYIEAVRGYGYKFAKPFSKFVDERQSPRSLRGASAPVTRRWRRANDARPLAEVIANSGS